MSEPSDLPIWEPPAGDFPREGDFRPGGRHYDKARADEIRHALAGSVTTIRARRFRCARGHESAGDQYWNYGGRSVRYCPHCFLDLIERECGGLEEAPE